jgi:hypothetical protein
MFFTFGTGTGGVRSWSDSQSPLHTDEGQALGRAPIFCDETDTYCRANEDDERCCMF